MEAYPLQNKLRYKSKSRTFDLEADISETKDLSKQLPEKVSELIKTMDKARTPAENPLFKLASERSSEEIKRLNQPKKKKNKKN